MKTLKLSNEKALSLYKNSNQEWKEILEENYGKDFFKPKEITDIVFDIDSLCEYLNIEYNDLVPYPTPKDAFQKYMNSCALIPKIVKVYNEGIILDWSNQNQRKYYPWFKFENGSMVFGRSYDYYCCFFGSVGFYKDEKTAKHIGKHFIDIYKEIALS